MSAYWKEKYQHTWEQSSQREKLVAEKVKLYTDHEVAMVGLGAGSTEFIDGSAADNGVDKGDADLRVAGTNIFLEVTGPLSVTDSTKPLWVRPDKIENARASIGKEIWIVHCCGDRMRVTCLDDGFFKALNSGEFKTVEPTIRGVRERFVEIPAHHPSVKSWEALT